MALLKFIIRRRWRNFRVSINRSVSATAARCWAQANKLPDSMDTGEPIN